MTQVVDDARLKTFLKEALLELMHERKDEFRALFAEALEELEDEAMIRAIDEGMETPSVPMDEVMQWLEDRV